MLLTKYIYPNNIINKKDIKFNVGIDYWFYGIRKNDREYMKSKLAIIKEAAEISEKAIGNDNNKGK